MGVLTSLEILILIALIGAFLQLTPGVFMLFYHYALGKKSKKTADDLALYFLAGVETTIIVLFLIVYYIIYFLLQNNLTLTTGLPVWLISGILVALALFSFFFYFRRGPSMSLFIHRRLAKSYDNFARDIRTRKKAFLLGFLSTLPELFLTIPLYIIATIEIMKWDNPSFPRPLLVFLGLFIVFGNLFFTRLLFRSDHNLAEIDRLRRKNKTFIRIMLSLFYLVLALLIILPEFTKYGI